MSLKKNIILLMSHVCLDTMVTNRTCYKLAALEPLRSQFTALIDFC